MDPAGSNRVHAHAMRAEFHCQRPHQAGVGRFRGAYATTLGMPNSDVIEAVNKIDPLLRLIMPRATSQRQRKRPEDVSLHDGGKLRVARLDRIFFQVIPGVVDQNGNRPGELLRLPDERGNGFQLRHVAGERKGFLPKTSAGFFQFLFFAGRPE